MGGGTFTQPGFQPIKLNLGLQKLRNRSVRAQTAPRAFVWCEEATPDLQLEISTTYARERGHVRMGRPGRPSVRVARLTWHPQTGLRLRGWSAPHRSAICKSQHGASRRRADVTPGPENNSLPGRRHPPSRPIGAEERADRPGHARGTTWSRASHLKRWNSKPVNVNSDTRGAAVSMPTPPHLPDKRR